MTPRPLPVAGDDPGDDLWIVLTPAASAVGNQGFTSSPSPEPPQTCATLGMTVGQRHPV